MTQQTAENNLHKWFWIFKHKLVDEFPEYHTSFDSIVLNANNQGLLYEVMEFAYKYLQIEANIKGEVDNLMVTNYIEALDYGYNEWVK